MTDEQLLEALIDLNVEIQTIHKALDGLGIPSETLDALRTEVKREDVRMEVLGKLSGRHPASAPPQ